MAPPKPRRRTKKPPPIVWIEVEAQLEGRGSKWVPGKITDPPKVEEIDAKRARRMKRMFKKDFPVGRYVEVVISYSRTRHWIYEGFIRTPKKTVKKRKKVPPKLAQFTEKLQEVSAKVKEEKAQREAERGVSSKPPAHVLAKRKRQKRKSK